MSGLSDEDPYRTGLLEEEPEEEPEDYLRSYASFEPEDPDQYGTWQPGCKVRATYQDVRA